MKILHLSNTTLSGAPYRLSKLYDKYTEHESHHIVWKRTILNRVFPVDMVGEEMTQDELQYWLDWCEIVHYHDVYKKQTIFTKCEVPKKPSVIQVHSPKGWFDHQAVSESGLPIAVIAQYHPREWPNLNFIVPNVIDIWEYTPMERNNALPVVSFAPSSGNGKGANDKGYSIVVPALRRMGNINFQKIFSRPFVECMQMKRYADVGIDDLRNGGYHLSSLEYLSLGVATICYVDEQTEKVVKDLTGCDTLPFIHNGRDNILTPLTRALNNHKWLGQVAREWVETHWSPEILCSHYTKMYESLV
jgi:hypothetical protein